MSRKEYLKTLDPLHIELVRMQSWVKEKRLRLLVIIEGRDAAGKGGAIKRIAQHLNPRVCRIVALDKPSDRERTQWYFQRFVAHLPAGGEIVLFDRSWYNRGGVERVMGFCAREETNEFLRSTPEFERMLIRSGILLLKIYFSISKKEQRRRLENRRKDPLRHWKLSSLDLKAQDRWDDYTRAWNDIFARTATPDAPWTMVETDEKRRARVNAIRVLLHAVDYPKKRGALLAPDPGIVEVLS